MSFSSRLRQAREQAGFTQQDLAEKLGITKSAVGNYENGVSSPKWDVLLRIFDVLQVEPNFLYQDSFSSELSGAVQLTPRQSALLSSFDQLNEEGQTILMVTHSAQAASHASRVLFIKDGEVFHQIYKGSKSRQEMYQMIADTLTILTTGGEYHA